MFPNPFSMLMYGTDVSTEGQRNSRADGVEYVIVPKQLDAKMALDVASISDEFVEFASNEDWQVFIRK